VLVVLDTSVLVAAWRSSAGASFALLEELRDETFTIALSVPLVIEYESVLLRHTKPPRRRQDVTALLDYLCLVGTQQQVFFLWRPLLRDPNDDMVAEVAVASQAHAIVTHNLKDFEAMSRFGVHVLSPGDFLVHHLRRP
jgi:putative PIN family toxin of toxin-antitoxin system